MNKIYPPPNNPPIVRKIRNTGHTRGANITIAHAK